VVECDLAKVEVAGSNPVSRSRNSSTRGIFFEDKFMPNGVLVRILISLAFGLPSLVLWLVLRPRVQRKDAQLAQVSDWLKVTVFVLLGIAVIAEALERRAIASALNINFWGMFLVLNWLQRRCGVNTGGLAILNISGENRSPLARSLR
jgi:peptidoglycan biosynthesis protein MviN/MurJ (putative lipid II flippase)